MSTIETNEPKIDLRNRFSITYFNGSKCLKRIGARSTYDLRTFAAHIRGLRQSGGRGGLPGIEDIHRGAILIEQVHDITVVTPGEIHVPPMILIEAAK